MGAMHMSLLGPEGLEQLAVRNMAACTQLKRQLAGVEGVTLPHDGQSHFNEFIVELPASTSACLAYLEANGVVGGFDVSDWYAEKTNQMLVTCRKRQAIGLLTVNIDASANDSTWHESEIGLRTAKNAVQWTSTSDWASERLSFSDDNIRTVIAWRFKQTKRYRLNRKIRSTSRN